MLSMTECFQLYCFFDWLSSFVVTLAKNKFSLKTLHTSESCREITELNICFDVNSQPLTMQIKQASCVPEAYDVILALVVRLKFGKTKQKINLCVSKEKLTSTFVKDDI